MSDIIHTQPYMCRKLLDYLLTALIGYWTYNYLGVLIYYVMTVKV